MVELFFDNSDGKWGAQVKFKKEGDYSKINISSLEGFDEKKAREFFEQEVKVAKRSFGREP